MKGAIIFLTVFIVFSAVTLGYHDLPPGRQLYGLLGVSETETPVIKIPATTLVSAVFNGVIYGVIAWLIDLIKKDRVSKDEIILFVHTGGSPRLYPFRDRFK